LNRKLLALALLSVAIVAAGYSFYYYQSTQTVAPTGKVKEFSISARSWEYNQTGIEVIAGDTVVLKITGIDDGSGNGHGFAVSEFGVTRAVRKGETTTVEFVANRRGTFTFRCSVPCGSGHNGMTGTLVVS